MSKYAGNTHVKLTKPKRSYFDMSHEKRLSTRMGKLTPIMIAEVLPGDSWNGSTEAYVKLAPMLAPIFHSLTLFVHHFFIPNRLLWKDFETFITGGRLGDAVETPPVPPFMLIDQVLLAGGDYLDVGSVADYLGVPPLADTDAAAYDDRTLDMMPAAAFWKVWYDYYRDRNFVDDIALLPMESGSQPTGLNTQMEFWFQRYRCWEHDYFTSALPFTQRGAEVLMPLQGSGVVNYSDVATVTAFPSLAAFPANTIMASNPSGGPQLWGQATDPVHLENIDSIELTNSDVSINDFRTAMALQQWMERNAVAGSRINETIMAHFATRTSDARLQRAEYIGGGRARFVIDEVMTTAYSEDASSEVVPPANPTGKGGSYLSMAKFNYHAEEWGFVVSILSVMPTSGYMQGLPRMFQARNTFLDYPWPLMANLGEQDVYDWEIFMSPANLPIDRTEAGNFGYQSRYSDWKQIHSSSHGDFRTSLKIWHLTRDFSASPNLGAGFVTFEDALQDRIFNVSGVDTLWIYLHNNVGVKRALPYFGVPSGLSSN